MTDVETKNKTIITRVRKPTAKNTPQEETPSEYTKTQVHCPVREHLRMYLEQTVKQITSTPEQIQVSYWVGPNTTVYNINVPRESIGQLLGSKGKNINGIRSLAAAMGALKGIRVIIEIPYFPK